MSRRKDSWRPPATSTGVIYTLHFDPPLGRGRQQAKHYTGFHGNPDTLDERLAAHASGRGAKLTAAQVRAGGSWRVASVVPGTYDDENRLKYRGAARRCPICKAEHSGSLNHDQFGGT